MSIWIIGASSGIGAALALKYAKNNKVIVSGRRIEKLAELANQNDNITIAPLDVLSPKLEDQIKEYLTKLGSPKLLIYAAGIAMHVQFSQITDLHKVYETVMGTNFTGLVRVMGIIPKCQFVVISSVAGEISPPYLSLYAAAKHALNGFCESLQNEGYDITIICPGYVKTEIDLHKIVGDGSSEEVKLNIDSNKYMDLDRACDLIIYAQMSHKRFYHLTYSGLIGTMIKPLLPNIINNLVKGEMYKITGENI